MKTSQYKNKKHTSKQQSNVTVMSLKADPHTLYEMAVQNVEQEYDFVNTTYRKIRGRNAHSLREDFCGTANMSCEWVRNRKKNTATGVDIDTEVLTWGKKNNLGKLTSNARKRITLVEEDVLTIKTTPAQVILAMNFSYQLFKTRKLMKHYFKQVHKSLTDDGILFMDVFGGSRAYKEMREKTKKKGFTYVWEQKNYNPITGDMTCHIHFHFPDKSRLQKAFTYEWRLWTLPELQELLDEAGFSNTTVHWEGTDKKTGQGNGIYKPSRQGGADPAWICFLTAEK